MNKNISIILDSVFNSNTGYDQIARGALRQAPNYNEIYSFVELLSTEPQEELIQKFIIKHPKFLTAIAGYADSQVLAIIKKPRIGQNYCACADYAILMYGQGGCAINLIEIEPSNEKLFTKKLNPAKRYQGAITQITDWNEWIKSNRNTFINDLINSAKRLELVSNKCCSSFRTVSPQIIKKTWDNFGGFIDLDLIFTIIIGRWSKLKENERSRLISLNKDNWFKTYTYEQMIRRGIERPFGTW